jgi:hypothetical protein
MTLPNADEFEDRLALSLKGLPGDAAEEIASRTALGECLDDGRRQLRDVEGLDEAEAINRLQAWCSAFAVVYVSRRCFTCSSLG